MVSSGGMCGEQYRDVWRAVQRCVVSSGGMCGEQYRDVWRAVQRCVVSSGRDV